MNTILRILTMKNKQTNQLILSFLLVFVLIFWSVKSEAEDYFLTLPKLIKTNSLGTAAATIMSLTPADKLTIYVDGDGGDVQETSKLIKAMINSKVGTIESISSVWTASCASDIMFFSDFMWVKPSSVIYMHLGTIDYPNGKNIVLDTSTPMHLALWDKIYLANESSFMLDLGHRFLDNDQIKLMMTKGLNITGSRFNKEIPSHQGFRHDPELIKKYLKTVNWRD